MSGPTRRPTPAGAATGGGAAAAASPARSWGNARAPPRIPPLRNSSRREIPSQLMASPPGLFVEERIIAVRARERPGGRPETPACRCDRVHSGLGGRGATIAPRRPVAGEGAIMPADYKLRLGDGTILAVDAAGLR